MSQAVAFKPTLFINFLHLKFIEVYKIEFTLYSILENSENS